MAAYVTYLTDVDEEFGPPESPVLEVGFVEDQVFLAIGTIDETHKTRTFTRDAEVSVRLGDLFDILASAVNARYEAGYSVSNTP